MTKAQMIDAITQRMAEIELKQEKTQGELQEYADLFYNACLYIN